MNKESFTFTAHTGCEGTEYNSAESIRYGLNITDIVEVDLNFTKEGKPVLAHTFAKKSSLPIEDAFRILSEFKDAKMNIDVKIPGDMSGIYDSAKKYSVEKNIFFTGIEKEKINIVKAEAPLVPFYLNVTLNPLFIKSERCRKKILKRTKEVGAIGINLDFRQCNEALVSLMHKNNLSVSLYTCNSERDIRRALKLSPDNITTKEPTLMKKILEKG